MRKLFALLTVLVVLAFASGCSSDGSEGSSKDTTTTTEKKSTPKDTTTTTEDEAAGDATEADYIEAFTTTLTSGDKDKGELVLADDEAACMAEGWVSAITVKTLQDAQASPADVAKPGFDTSALDLTPAQGEAMVQVFDTCEVDAAALLIESLTQGLTPDQQACAQKAVDKELVDALLAKTFSGQNADTEFNALGESLTKACDLPG